MADDRVICRTPTPGKKPTTVVKSKFDLIRGAILNVVPKGGGGVLFGELPRLVREELARTGQTYQGSIPWMVTTVKLEMEVRGELERIEGESPQRLRRPARTRK